MVACLQVLICLSAGRESLAQEGVPFTFMFYNVENLFDVEDDALTNDDEFTPGGEKQWDKRRYFDKIDRICRVITGVGGFEMPAIIGLCEIENSSVLFDLVDHRLLRRYDYRIIHRDSPDERGIDVALLYRPDVYSPVSSGWIQVSSISDSSFLTRDILYSKGTVSGKDTLHVFINHWPSRWGGVEASRPRRIDAARHLRNVTDSLFATSDDMNIIIAGDFNDTPADSSIAMVLGAVAPGSGQEGRLINLSVDFTGTLKYRSDWEVYDQLIVSDAAFTLENNRLIIMRTGVYDPDFLLTEDERYMGKKPFRTYSGPQYLGGFSDHLPVYLKYGPANEK